jgi:hypothetical protein
VEFVSGDYPPDVLGASRLGFPLPLTPIPSGFYGAPMASERDDLGARFVVLWVVGFRPFGVGAWCFDIDPHS